MWEENNESTQREHPGDVNGEGSLSSVRLSTHQPGGEQITGSVIDSVLVENDDTGRKNNSNDRVYDSVNEEDKDVVNNKAVLHRVEYDIKTSTRSFVGTDPWDGLVDPIEDTEVKVFQKEDIKVPYGEDDTGLEDFQNEQKTVIKSQEEKDVQLFSDILTSERGGDDVISFQYSLDRPYIEQIPKCESLEDKEEEEEDLQIDKTKEGKKEENEEDSSDDDDDEDDEESIESVKESGKLAITTTFDGFSTNSVDEAKSLESSLKEPPSPASPVGAVSYPSLVKDVRSLENSLTKPNEPTSLENSLNRSTEGSDHSRDSSTDKTNGDIHIGDGLGENRDEPIIGVNPVVDIKLDHFDDDSKSLDNPFDSDDQLLSPTSPPTGTRFNFRGRGDTRSLNSYSDDALLSPTLGNLERSGSFSSLPSSTSSAPKGVQQNPTLHGRFSGSADERIISRTGDTIKVYSERPGGWEQAPHTLIYPLDDDQWRREARRRKFHGTTTTREDDVVSVVITVDRKSSEDSRPDYTTTLQHKTTAIADRNLPFTRSHLDEATNISFASSPDIYTTDQINPVMMDDDKRSLVERSKDSDNAPLINQDKENMPFFSRKKKAAETAANDAEAMKMENGGADSTDAAVENKTTEKDGPVVTEEKKSGDGTVFTAGVTDDPKEEVKEGTVQPTSSVPNQSAPAKTEKSRLIDDPEPHDVNMKESKLRDHSPGFLCCTVL